MLYTKVRDVLYLKKDFTGEKRQGGFFLTLREYLKKHYLLTDGAMGTYYASLNLKGATVLPEDANLTEPEVIAKIHRQYLEAGAMLVRTNTFAANKITLKSSERERTKRIEAALNIAKQTIKEFREETKISPFLAGDIGSILGCLPEEKEEEAWKEYCDIVDIFLSKGVDAIVCETFSEEQTPLKIAQYIKEKNPDMFVITQIALERNGYAGNGLSAQRILEKMALHPATDAVGFNCGIGSGHMLTLTKTLLFPEAIQSGEKYFVVVPNAGYPEQLQNRMVFVNNAEYFADNMKQICQMGAKVIGACCGSTPEYIRALNKKLIQINKNEKQITIYVEPQLKQPVSEEKQPKKNDFYKKLSEGKKVIACELDPPYDADDSKILAATKILKQCSVDMITIADSPMGKSRIDSILMACKLHHITQMPVMPHICCRDRNMISMRASLLGAYVNNIRNLLLVTGDPVPQNVRTKTTGVFDYYSIPLMHYVEEMNREHFAKDPFIYGGALNYNFPNLEKIIERMERKIEAGASFFLTQPIYSKEDIERIAQIKQRVSTKILCGIMPLTSYKNAVFIKNEVAGIHIPNEIVEKYHQDMTREEAEWTGAKIAKEIIKELEDIADGYYIMLQFNRASFMEKIQF